MNSPVQIDPEILSGTPCFAGTRVPVRTLFDVIANGQTVDDFLHGFPTVERAQVQAVLELARDRVIASAIAAAR